MDRSVVALTDLAHGTVARRRGLGAPQGLGIVGPWGDNPAQQQPGTYEVTGTQVNLHKGDPTGVSVGYFNNKYGPNNNIVVGTPDQVSFDGDTADSGGLRFAKVTAKTGDLAGQVGFVAMKYMAPIGWTASHGGTGPAQGGGGTSPSSPPSSSSTASMTTTKKVVIYGGLAALAVGLIAIGVGAFGTKKGRALRRLHRIRKHRARRRRR